MHRMIKNVFGFHATDMPFSGKIRFIPGLLHILRPVSFRLPMRNLIGRLAFWGIGVVRIIALI